jgi:hypothetical protein
MDADVYLNQIEDRVRTSLKITTNLATPDGQRIAIAWHHKAPTEIKPCLVIADSLSEALRKVIKLEEDLLEMEGSCDATL